MFESFDHLKANSPYGHYIKDIGYDPFFVLFWSEQVDLHNDITKYLGNSSSCHATGSVCVSIKKAGFKAKHNLLTVLITHVEEKIVTTCQMLSERNDANLITFWLREFIKSGAKKRPRMVTDLGKGLRNGICLAFNNVSFKKYNGICLLLLQKKIKSHSLDTQMATDIAHLVHLLDRWKNFTKMPTKVQQLYRHCIGFLSTVEDLDHFEIFFKSVVTLAFCKTCNTECAKAGKLIIKLIQTFKFDDSVISNKEDLSK